MAPVYTAMVRNTSSCSFGCSSLYSLAVCSWVALYAVTFVSGESWCGHRRAQQVQKAYVQQADHYAMRFIMASKRTSTRKRALQEQETRPLKIHFEYQLLDSTGAALRDYIMNRLMPAAAAVLKRTMRVNFLARFLTLRTQLNHCNHNNRLSTGQAPQTKGIPDTIVQTCLVPRKPVYQL